MSSYEKNNFGEIIEGIITTRRPSGTFVELGVLDGYSTLHIAKAIKRNHDMPIVNAHLDAYDLFEDYPYKHGNLADVQKRLDENGLMEFVTLIKGDAFTVHDKYPDNTVYFLHVDLSNTGEIVRKIMDNWDRKIVVGGIILFEGGSVERDRIDWMVKYNKEPIRPEIEKNPIINSKYVYGTYLNYPRITFLFKKRE